MDANTTQTTHLVRKQELLNSDYLCKPRQKIRLVFLMASANGNDVFFSTYSANTTRLYFIFTTLQRPTKNAYNISTIVSSIIHLSFTSQWKHANKMNEKRIIPSSIQLILYLSANNAPLFFVSSLLVLALANRLNAQCVYNRSNKLFPHYIILRDDITHIS